MTKHETKYTCEYNLFYHRFEDVRGPLEIPECKYEEDRYKAEKDYIKAAELFLRIMGYCWM